MKIDKATADERLARFEAEPGVKKGLNTEEMLELFQYLIDSEEVYKITGGTQYHVQAWAAEGYLSNFDESRMLQD